MQYNRKNSNVILDIDNTLLHSVGISKHKQMNIKGNFQTYKDKDFVVYYRPKLQQFLDYLFSNYNVAVWSAGSKEYVDYITKKIILSHSKPEDAKVNRQLDFVFSWNQCEESMDIYGEECLKNLKFVWGHKTLPVLQHYNPHNTILIDDLFPTYKEQPDNVIWAEYFDVKFPWAEKDDYLSRLVHLLPS